MKRPKRIWKQIWALTLVLAMLGTSLGQPVFTVYAAETENGGENTEDGQSAETPDPEVKCICTELCTEEAVREDCPVCAAEGADLSDCKGKTEEEITEEASGENASTQGETGSKETEEGTDEGTESEEVAEENGPEQNDIEEVDVSDWLYQEGGMGIPSMPTVFSAQNEIEAYASADWEAAKAVILEGLHELSYSISIDEYQISKDEIGVLYTEVINENPDLFYVQGEISYSLDSNSIVTEIIPKYDTENLEEKLVEYAEAFEKAYSEALPNPDGMDDVQKARALHDYLVQHVKYDESLTKRDAYTALVEGSTVCQGYSLSYGALLKEAGIEFSYVTSTSMNHMWNLVRLDGQWYHVDVTWDDPVRDRTGIVRHLCFLNSDSKIGSEEGGHYDWVSDKGCSSEKYDNAYWQTNVDSAIFYIDGAEYYLQNNSEAGKVSLVKRRDNTESVVYSFPARWNVWEGTSYYTDSYAALSYYNGLFYFNDTLNVYKMSPTGSEAEKIYTYSQGDGYIYGSLICDGEMILDIAKNPGEQIPITIPLSQDPIESLSISASSTEINYGYTTAPVLQATATLGTDETVSYQWYKVEEDTETAIPGENQAAYTLETGLGVGSYIYRVKASVGSYTKSADILITVAKTAGEITNIKYPVSYAYSSAVIAAPDTDDFNTTAGTLTFTWYKDSVSEANKLNTEPKDAGRYILKVDASETDNISAVSLEVAVTIAKAKLNIKAAAQTITYGNSIASGVAQVTATGLKGSDVLSEITLTSSDTNVTDDGKISPQNAVIKNNDADVTANYEITYEEGALTITKSRPSLSFKSETDLSKIYDGNPVETTVSEMLDVTGASDKDVRFVWYKESISDTNRLSGAPSEVGSYVLEAVIDATANTEEAKTSCSFDIRYLEFESEQIAYNNAGKSSYYNSPVEITATGYTVSENLTGPFNASYTMTVQAEDGSKTKALYFRNGSGKITDAQAVEVTFDVTAPAGSIGIGARWWESFLETITFGRYKADSSVVTIKGSDTTSGLAAEGIQYYIYQGDTPYTSVDALKEANVAWNTYSDSNKPEILEGKQTVIYAKLTDQAENVTYVSSEGILLDNTAPSIQNAVSGTVTDTQAEIAFTVDEACTYYYVVLPASAAEPDANAVITTADNNAAGAVGGTELTDAAAFGNGSITDAMLADGTGTAEILITELQANTEYRVYIVAADKVTDISESAEGVESCNISTVVSCSLKTEMTSIETAALTLEGRAIYGGTLTASTDWKGIVPGQVTYRWYRQNEEIADASEAVYTLTQDDIGMPIRVEITASNCSGTLTAIITVSGNGSDVVEKADCPEGNLAVNGTVNDERGIDTFTFTGKEGIVYEYSLDGGNSWKDVETIEPEETGNIITGTIAIGNVAYTVGMVQVRAKETEIYKAGTVISNATAFTAQLEGTVMLLGGNRYGDTLTANVTGAQEEAKLVYSFYRNGETEPVQTGGNPGYTLKAEDVGKTISVKVTAEGYAGELTPGYGMPIQPRSIVVKADSPSKTYGETDRPLTWSITGNSLVEGDQLKGELTREEGEDAGIYEIRQGTLTNENNPGYAITFEPGTLTINKAQYTVRTTAAIDSEGRQTVIAGIGSFAEPEFISDNNETVDGTLTYRYGGEENMTYDAVEEALAALPVDTKGEITYQFVPDPDGNYIGDKSGHLPFIVKDVEFTVKGEAAEASNAVTVKENPVYGDSWEEILKLAEITATAGTDEDSEKSHFSLNVNGTPDAGTQEYTVLYNGRLNGKTYTDVEVCSGTVEIAKKTVTAEAGSYKVSKVYDGTTNAGTGSGELTVTGILEEDTGVTVSAEPDPYNDPNAGGQTELRVALSLTGEGSGNYQLAETELQVPCEITPREINPVITVTGTYEYTGSPIVPEFTAAYTDEAGQTVQLAETDYTAEFVNNTDAGTAGIRIKPAEGGNYTWEKAEADFTIEKAAYPGITGNDLVLQTSARYGSAVEFELADYLAEGAVIGNITLTDVDDVLDGTPSVNGTVLSYKLVNNAETVGDEAVITINITDAKNYRFYNIKITVTVEDKLTQDLKFETTVLEKNYGDADFVNALSGLAEGSAAAYTSSDPAVASVDSKTGEVRILKAGTVQITASASETADYAPADITYTLHIARRALAWDVSELTAVDREDKIADKKASLYGSLKVSGVLAADAEDAVFTCPADKLNGTYATVAAGSQKVALSWADAENPVRLQGEKAENYTLPAALPQITGTIHAKPAVLPVPPESTDGGQYRLEAETGISEVPEALKSIEKLNTPGKIETEMKLAVQRKTSGILPENVVVYDVQLLINVNGTGWVPATEENFPAGGITVTLPYPSGTGKDTHDFTVAHMLTRDMNGLKAGDVEYPSVTKTDGGVQFRVYSLSPISIGWKTVKASALDTDTGHKDNGNGSGGGSHSSGSSVTQAASAPTGDDSPILLYAVLLAAAAAGIAAVVVTGKKKNKNRR